VTGDCSLRGRVDRVVATIGDLSVVRVTEGR
jgi:hypothetical protein